MRFTDEVLATRTATPHETLRWFAIKTHSRAEQKAVDWLEGRGIECYVAMKFVKEQKRIFKRPAVAGLVFVRTTAEQLFEEQRRYGADKMFIYFERPTNHPQEISDCQMIPFILLTATSNESLEYIDSEVVEAKSGDMVRVTDGPFRGAVGKVIRIKGDRRLVVNIEGVTAVVTHHLPSSMIEKIEE